MSNIRKLFQCSKPISAKRSNEFKYNRKDLSVRTDFRFPTTQPAFINSQNTIHSIGGSRGGCEGRTPPRASKFFRFHAVFGKIWRVHAPPGGFTPPPSGKSWIRHCIGVCHLPNFSGKKRQKQLLRWFYKSKSNVVRYYKVLISPYKVMLY